MSGPIQQPGRPEPLASQGLEGPVVEPPMPDLERKPLPPRLGDAEDSEVQITKGAQAEPPIGAAPSFPHQPEGATAGNGDQRSARRTVHIKERDKPEPSSVWQTGGFAFLTCAAATIIAALTVADDAPIHQSDLLIVTGGLILSATLCFLAHFDVNRGRRTRQREIEERS